MVTLEVATGELTQLAAGTYQTELREGPLGPGSKVQSRRKAAKPLKKMVSAEGIYVLLDLAACELRQKIPFAA